MDLLGFREKHTPQGVGHCRGLWPWNGAWLGFARVNSYANEWEDQPNHWGTTHSCLLTVPWSCPATRLGIKVYLNLTCWTQLILIGLCYALALCHSFKGCALPPSLLFHALFLSLVQAHNVASTIFWRDNQKISGPWEGSTI